MTRTLRIAAVIVAALSPLGWLTRAAAQGESLAAPGFHHLHLNSTSPEAAIAFYTKAFPATSKRPYPFGGNERTGASPE